MIKTLSKARKQERVKFLIPRSVQDCIPIRRIWADGIFQVGHQFSKTWSFTDINYSIAGKDDKTAMFLDYCDLLNALASGASAKITLYNRRINKEEFERSVLLPLKEDGLDNYREEFNEMLRAQVTESNNSIVRERYLTISVVKRNIEEARTYFARVGTDLTTKLAALSSVAQELSLNERLRIFRDFFRPADPPAAEFDIHQKARRGQHFKDWLCPSSMEFTADHFKIDDRVGRVLYLQDFASYLKDSFVSELCDLDRELMLSIDILPIPTDEAARQLQNTLLGVETNVTNWQRKQNANNNWSAIVPYDMELQRKETKEILRQRTGGYHARTPHGCLLVSFVLQVLFSLLAAATKDLYVLTTVILLSEVAIFLLGPANHPELHLSAKELKAVKPRMYVRQATMFLAYVVALLAHQGMVASCIAMATFAVAVLLAVAHVDDGEIHRFKKEHVNQKEVIQNHE